MPLPGDVHLLKAFPGSIRTTKAVLWESPLARPTNTIDPILVHDIRSGKRSRQRSGFPVRLAPPLLTDGWLLAALNALGSCVLGAGCCVLRAPRQNCGVTF